MQGDSSRARVGVAAHADVDEWSNEERQASWPSGSSARIATKDRLARLARTIEKDVIPRLVLAHRPPADTNQDDPHPAHAAHAAGIGIVKPAEVAAFVSQILNDADVRVDATVTMLRARSVTVETLYLDLFGPTARRLGEMWEEDECDFSTVTVALGRLQRLLRELSPAFGTEVEHPESGRRALFVQPRDEQHSFGLSMVAEFFRRAGWDVIGGVGGAVADPAAMVKSEWVDVIGYSIGSDGRLPWLREAVRSARAASCNPRLRVLVGGPPFVLRPELAAEIGADGTARDGKEAPVIAEHLLSAVLRA